MDETPPAPWVPSDPQERFGRLLFPSSREDWEAANAENEAEPREPGRYKVGFGGPPQVTKPTTMTCEDCGKVIRSGRGIRFGDPEVCPLHPEEEDCLMVHVHWGRECPAWKHRRWRFWHIHTWGKLERRWKSWRWRRQAKKERREAGLE